MKKVFATLVLAATLALTATAQSPSFAASKKPIAVTVTGPSTASVSHTYSGKINLLQPIKGLNCTVFLDGTTKTQTFALPASGKSNFSVSSKFLKKQYSLGHNLALLTVTCSNSVYAGTSPVQMLRFTY